MLTQDCGIIIIIIIIIATKLSFKEQLCGSAD
jgi:hypothetical protein